MNKILKVSVIAAIVLSVISAGVWAFNSYISARQSSENHVHSCVVTDTHINYRTSKSGGNRYFVETSNCGKFTAQSEIVDGKFGHDIYRNIHAGKTYDFKTYGSESQFLGFQVTYANIAEATESK